MALDLVTTRTFFYEKTAVVVFVARKGMARSPACTDGAHCSSGSRLVPGRENTAFPPTWPGTAGFSFPREEVRGPWLLGKGAAVTASGSAHPGRVPRHGW
jgi:hypothetical protein